DKQDKLEKYEKDQIFIRKMFPEDYSSRYYSFNCDNDPQLCGKWLVLKPLLEQWKKEGSKVIIFSKWTKMMDILSDWLEQYFPGFVRLDGKVPANERLIKVDEFQNDASKFIFLASTTSGGVGLNLTSANKVVPSWNPSSDAQAMDRVVRIGQKRSVECLRLISKRSNEELIYHRQIYKKDLFDISNTGNASLRKFQGVQGDKNNQGEIFG
ncbi:P-loop containing nucleoside triphosphate hydrolase protein, partial [Phakopsora pachyrhizi]